MSGGRHSSCAYCTILCTDEYALLHAHVLYSSQAALHCRFPHQDTVGSAHASFSNRLWPLRVVVMVSRSDASSPETPLPRPSTLARPPDASATSWHACTIRLMRSSCSRGGRAESPTLMTSI